MQTTTLPIQISGAANAPSRPNVTTPQDAGQSFSQTFSQAAQRQAAPQGAPAAQGSKPAAQQPQKQNGAPATTATTRLGSPR